MECKKTRKNEVETFDRIIKQIQFELKFYFDLLFHIHLMLVNLIDQIISQILRRHILPKELSDQVS